jgi:hypothetical protein
MARDNGYWIPIGCGLMIAAALALAVWEGARTNTHSKHCEQDLGGIAVQRLPSGGVVCIRADGVLKAYS